MVETSSEACPEPLRWSTERDLALVESGIVEESRHIELNDGQIVASMPRGKLHDLLFLALQQAFRRMDFSDPPIAVQAAVVLREGNTHDPEFALLRAPGPAADHALSSAAPRPSLEAPGRPD